jgi:Uma2 family endonuclease
VRKTKLIDAINPTLKTVEVFHPGQADPFQVLKVGEELSGEDVIPGFKLAVQALFE